MHPIEQPLTRRVALQWRHNEHDGVSNYRSLDCLLNRLSRRRSKKISKLRVTGHCEGIHRSPHKGPVTRKMFPFDDVIMLWHLPNAELGDFRLATMAGRLYYIY